eukprot:TRINITY_DN15892_c0_g1_i2.p3 TRINITY_DN15892_c0_g1~~TRINITY_DN15892_c0_g1_i2.p3  ORF type:complete len:188 (-),score=23.02 TRINITY_DN15892_c0_g1_i2:88-651(-)
MLTHTKGLFTAVMVTATITNSFKALAGRPRPNYFHRCFPDGQETYDENNLPVCQGGRQVSNDIMRSFPSGHTSWSTSGLGFLSLFLLAKLRAFDGGSGHGWKLVVGLFPLVCAGMIAISRVRDYYHHWEDVVAGFLLGIFCAYCSYRQHYPGVMDTRDAGIPHFARRQTTSTKHTFLDEKDDELELV